MILTRKTRVHAGACWLLGFVATAAPGATFQRHVIDTFRSGYQVAVADVNGDGRPDIIALSTEANRVVWYENPTWTPHLICQTARNIDLAPRRLDGHFGLALATGFYFSDSSRGGQILWLEPNGTNTWMSYPIAEDPVVHRLRWGDLDGDGKPELVHAPIFGPGSDQAIAPKPCHLWAFRPPADPRHGLWQRWVIDESLTVLHGIYVSDLDGDGRDEILTASFEGVHRFEFRGNGPDARWTKTQIGAGAAPKDTKPGTPKGASEVAPGRLSNGRRFIATIEPWHGGMVVIYTQTNRTGLWERRVLDDRLKEGHALLVTNLDHDGNDQIVAGWRGGSGGVAIYRCADGNGTRWEKSVLDPAITVDGMAVADLNGDGLPDLVALAGRSNLLVWYEQTKAKGPSR